MTSTDSTSTALQPASVNLVTRLDTAIQAQQGDELVTYVKSLKISSQDEYNAAAEKLIAIKEAMKAIDAFFKPHVEAAHDVWKGLTSSRAALLENPTKAEDAIKRIMGAWSHAEKLRKQEEEAKRVAELKKAEEDSNIAQAQALHAAGMVEEADMVLSTPIFVAPTKVRAPNVRGLSTVEQWHFEITDPTKINPEYMTPNESKIRAQTKISKGDTPKVVGDGVRVWPTDATRVNTANARKKD